MLFEKSHQIVKSYAKINLSLKVLNKREDGYHNLETVFYPIPLCDTLQVDPIDDSREYVLETAGYKIEGKSEDNLIVKVYPIKKKF